MKYDKKDKQDTILLNDNKYFAISASCIDVISCLCYKTLVNVVNSWACGKYDIINKNGKNSSPSVHYGIFYLNTKGFCEYWSNGHERYFVAKYDTSL